MNKNEFEGNWHHLKGKIKEKWGKFTDDDITRCNGKFENLIAQLEKKYGYTKEHAEREIKNLYGSFNKENHLKDKFPHKDKDSFDHKHKNNDTYEDKKDKHRKAS